MENLEHYIDIKDPKVKHVTGEYVNMKNAPDPSDILYYMISKKKKKIVVEELISFFGQDKTEIINLSINELLGQSILGTNKEGNSFDLI